MKFLIIGASGFIGRHMLAYAKSLGYEVLGTASRPRPDEGLLGLDLDRDRLTDKVPISFFQTGGPIFVVVSAAISQIDRCFRERDVTREVNVVNTMRLMEEAAALGARPVYLTSSFVFDGRVGYYTESDPRSPISEYGRQKADIESICCQSHSDWFLVRLDKIVGDDPAEKHLFTEWHQWQQAGHPIVCMANQLFSPTLVDDVAQAIILGCQKGLTGLYNVSNSEYFTRDELARQFFRMLGHAASIICKTQQELGFSDLRPEKSCLDAERFVQATGIHFTTMRQVINKFKKTIKKNALA
jgi:dTDP-4-dehydrorhamnose reductase